MRRLAAEAGADLVELRIDNSVRRRDETESVAEFIAKLQRPGDRHLPAGLGRRAMRTAGATTDWRLASRCRRRARPTWMSSCEAYRRRTRVVDDRRGNDVDALGAIARSRPGSSSAPTISPAARAALQRSSSS